MAFNSPDNTISLDACICQEKGGTENRPLSHFCAHKAFQGETDFAGRGRAAGREAGKSKKQGAGKRIPRALVVDLIGLFIVGQGTVPCPTCQGTKNVGLII